MDNRKWKNLVAVIGLILAVAMVATPAAAEKDPVRSGKVFEVAKAGVWTWIGARDDSGNVFWVMASNCTVGVGGTVEVLEGKLYEKLEVKDLGRVFENCYEGRLIRINGQELKAFGAHGLPKGCIDLGGAG